MRVRVGEFDIAYQQAGRGPPLVFLHGVLCDSRVWRRQLAELADEFTVVAWDEPGAGGSSQVPENFGLADYADCLAGFIEALELDPAHVAGLSWGGVVAQELYRRHPERIASLILADTYAGWKGSLSEEECAARLAAGQQVSDLPRGEFIRRFLPGLVTDGAPDSVASELFSIMSDFDPVSALNVATAVAACDHRDLLPRIAVPTLLLWGEADARSPLNVAQKLRDGIPGARLIVIPSAGHMSNMEQPDRFNAAVREFCRTDAASITV
jgi:pimeloyl-ACP methyl ester carboxylesterase